MRYQHWQMKRGRRLLLFKRDSQRTSRGRASGMRSTVVHKLHPILTVVRMAIRDP